MDKRPDDVPSLLGGHGRVAHPSYDPAIAGAIGVKPAMVLAAVWRATHAPGSRTRQHEGRTFVYLPPWAVGERLAIDRSTARRTLNDLVALGLLLRARVKGDGRGADGWFSVDAEAVRFKCPGASLFAPAPPSPRRRVATRDVHGGLFAGPGAEGQE